jgi:hypothetical protein
MSFSNFDDKIDYNADRLEVISRLGRKGWHPVPNLFAILHEYEDKLFNEESPEDEGRRVPASFHKFLHILWREIFFARPEKEDWTAEFYDEQFNMRPSDAGKWKWALAESGLFQVWQIQHVKKMVDYGNYESVGNRGPLSRYKYNTQATETDWKRFYKALRGACAECPRPFKVHEWRAIVRRHVQANHAGATGAEGGAITRA